MKEKLTIFTPAYNRAYSLHRCYESLLKQSNKDFIWLIIDDGSTDNTSELVKSWQDKNNEFKIEYVYKENGGMHTAHNKAYELINTELNMCIDSDDYVANEAVDKILSFWNEHGSKDVAGIIGLDATFEDKIIGTCFDKNIKSTTLGGFLVNGGKGDKKLVYRTEIIKQYPPYPEFEGEKYVSLGYKYLLCDQDYELLTLNEILCNVEYQIDGSSMNMFKQYLNNPKGFAFFRKVAMVSYPSLKRRFIECIHYVSSSMILKNKRYILESPKKVLTIIATPLGIVLTFYIKYMSNKLIILEGSKK